MRCVHLTNYYYMYYVYKVRLTARYCATNY